MYPNKNFNSRSPTSISSWGTVPSQLTSAHSPSFYPPPSPYYLRESFDYLRFCCPSLTWNCSAGSVPGSNVPAPPLLHPLLQVSSQLTYDIRNPPGPIAGLAFQPSLTRARISVLGHPGWIIEVKNPNGITVQDILNTLYFHFQLPIHHAAYSALPAETVYNSEDHFRRRVGGNRADYIAGIKRLDCLCFQFRFIGLSPSTTIPGIWNLHLKM